MSVTTQLIQLAADEGQATAIQVIEQAVASLESLAEIGSPAEVVACGVLLTSLEFAVQQIRNTNAVDIAAEPYEYLGLDDMVRYEDRVKVVGSQRYVPVASREGTTLRQMWGQGWRSVRRDR